MLKLLPICLLNQSTREDNFFHMFRNLRKIETLQNYFSRWNLKFSWKETKIVSNLFKWGMQELLNISLRWLENGPVEERKFFCRVNTAKHIYTFHTIHMETNSLSSFCEATCGSWVCVSVMFQSVCLCVSAKECHDFWFVWQNCTKFKLDYFSSLIWSTFL